MFKVGLRLLGAFLESVERGGSVAGAGDGDTPAGGCRGNVETKLVKRVVACLDVRCTVLAWWAGWLGGHFVGGGGGVGW